MIIERINKKFGSVLAFVLIVLFVMTLITFAIASLSSQNLSNVVGEYWEDRARFGAFSGVHRAISELQSDPNYGGPMLNVPLDGDPQVEFSFELDSAVGDAVGHWAFDNRTWVPPGCVFIRSVGTIRNVASSGVTSLAAIIAPQRPVFNDALFGRTRVVLDNSNTTSWHSDASPDEGELNAHIATNSIAANALTARNTSIIDGDAISGVDPGNTSTPWDIDGSSILRGGQRRADENKTITTFVSPLNTAPVQPPPAIPTGVPFTLPPGRYAGLAVGPDQTVVLMPGTYHFNDGPLVDSAGGLPAEIRLDPTVTRSEPVIIYLDGGMAIWDGAVINHTAGVPNEPRLLQFYTTDTVSPTQVIVGHTDQVSFTLAGNDLDVTLQSTSFRGGIIADEIQAFNSEINYDQALAGVPLDGSGGFDILSMVTESEGDASWAAANTTGSTPPAAPPPPTAPPPATTDPPPPPPPTAPPPPPPPYTTAPPPPPPTGPPVP